MHVHNSIYKLGHAVVRFFFTTLEYVDLYISGINGESDNLLTL